VVSGKLESELITDMGEFRLGSSTFVGFVLPEERRVWMGRVPLLEEGDVGEERKDTLGDELRDPAWHLDDEITPE